MNDSKVQISIEFVNFIIHDYMISTINDVYNEKYLPRGIFTKYLKN